MDSNNVFHAWAEGTDPLYKWWFDAVPSFLAGLAPAASADPAAAESNAGAPPLLMGQISQALGLAQRLTKPLYEGLFEALTLNQSGQPFDWFEKSLQGRMRELTDRLTAMSQAMSGQPGLVNALGPEWASAPFAALTEAMKPLSLNLERTYGGLADAFGLATTRELRNALRDMAMAAVAHRQAQGEYLGLVAGAIAKGNDALMAQLAETGRRGESVDSVKSLMRLWARAADESMHTAMRSPEALEASARLVRTATRSRAQQQRVVAIASQALNIPTRAEVDEAYREIQELKRELRRLRKPQALEVSSADGVGEPPPAIARERATSEAPAPRRAAAKAPAARKGGARVGKVAST